VFIPVSTLAIETASNMAMGHLVVRLEPPGDFQPYIETLLGLRYLFTKTLIRNDFIVQFRDDPIATEVKFEDLSLSAGAGAGFNIRLYSDEMGWSGRRGDLSMNVGVRYLLGTRAQYVPADGIQEADGVITFGRARARTDVLVPQLGFRVAF
jgi:hypothetical protein